MKTIRGWYPLDRTPDLLRLLDEQSAAGYELAGLGAFACRFRAGAEGFQHRASVCGARPGSASELELRLRWERAGWQLVCRRGSRMIFRAPVGTPAPEDAALAAALTRAISRRETFRAVALVLAALCLVAGYALDGTLVLRLATLPLAIAALLTWRISALEKAKNNI